MKSTAPRVFTISLAAAIIAACGGGDSSSTAPPTGTSAPQSANVSLLLSDASTEDWATIGIKVISVALVPQGGGANVVVYSAAAPAPVVNLAQLDQIAELLGSVSVPVGTYTGAVITVSGNSSDLLLTVAADPAATFTTAAGLTIAAGQIQLQHTQGAAASLTVPIDITFATPVAVSATTSNALDIEFDLGHPAFIVPHVMGGANGTLWAVNFDGPVHHHPRADLTRVVLRHAYGAVSAVATDNTAITITREFPTQPVVDPETAVSTAQSLTLLADATNGTLFYDLDANTTSTIKNFSSEISLVGKSVRIAARFQQDGTLVATRIWASSQFNLVWASPEGHVLHVDAAANTIAVANESGRAVALTIDAATQFFWRQPQDAPADATPIATGTSFIANHELARGFKVHTSVVDPTATPLVAQSVEIETAVYDGTISAASSTGFTTTRNFRTTSDDYVTPLGFIDATTANGNDSSDAAITGFKYWNFAYPTLLTSGSAAITDFDAAVNGSVNFGGTVGAVLSRGASYVVWNDPANPNGWSVSATVLTPALLPLSSVTSGVVNTVFTMTATGGTAAVSVDIGTAAGSATLVYQVDRSSGIVTVTSLDVTTSTGLATLTTALTAGTPVKVYGVPQADGTLRAYVLTYFTGDAPTE